MANPAGVEPALNPGFESIQRNWDPALERFCAKILPGEYYVAVEDESITTVLGSCISACIRVSSTSLRKACQNTCSAAK